MKVTREVVEKAHEKCLHTFHARFVTSGHNAEYRAYLEASRKFADALDRYRPEARPISTWLNEERGV